MASEEFISLGEPCETDTKDEEGTSLQNMPLNVNGGVPSVSECQLEGEPSTLDNTKASERIIDLEEERDQVDGNPITMGSTKASDVIIDLEEGQVEDMDLSDDDIVVVKHQHLNASIQSGTSLADVQGLHGVSVELDKANGLENGSHASKNILVDESPIRGVKRARIESTEPSVRVIYSNLTRESKRKLMELMQQWSEWQTRKQNTLMKFGEEDLEYGEETYYPALHVGSEKSCAVSFWVDNQAKESVPLDDDSVPLYDREFTLGSTPLGDPSNTKRADKDDSRCFNCGSYSHALKECPKPRDNAAINNARKQHNLKRNISNVNRGQNRYYVKTPGKFDDLRPGVLGPETRECLGIRENDPPPWLHRMRELGYPPGYLEVVDEEDKPSGITIFGDEDITEEYEEGELPDQGEAFSPRKRETVEFPGINGPVPENGDHWLWDSTPPQYSGRLHSSDLRKRDRDPPGADRYSSRYHSYDYGPASPSHGRSYPDRGRRSSSGYENLPTDDGAWTPTAYSSRQYSSHYSPSSETSSQHSRDRYDRHHHHRR
ncbi:zinc finger CCHC domain-containing protein 8 homolog isoform X2 [Oryza brachyantha]|uniref:zinc finger CCHC domain-containing protein 8 homolog isoform X2 n=1 Tax=Oryza brachyantha TaxID=4533 RepID=UPI001ADC6783|nr:zinc finger CCHC domain-containing protein 8 homolog isoform X2 [Oryza brachyantha]